MHRGLSAFNVVFFESARDLQLASIVEPFVMGFCRSRPDEESHFTLGPSENLELKEYYHPNYLRLGRHRLEYDYYSLGLVLLEIGHWRILRSMTRGATDRKPGRLLDHLQRKYVDGLDAKMGSEYEAVVRTCLTMSEGSSARQGNSAGVLQQFYEHVASRLEKCHV